MDRHLISLAVAILLVHIGLDAMVDATFTPDKIEDELRPYEGDTPHVPVTGQYSPNIKNSTCLGRGDVRYHTFDARNFSYNTPTTKLGVMVMSWMGLSWWVVTTQELFNGGPKTRIKDVYMKCANIYFLVELGPMVNFYRWEAGSWGLIPPPLKSTSFTCFAVPMTVEFSRHYVKIHMTPKHSAADSGVRGICGDYNGFPQNDYIDLEPPILPPWKPLLVPVPA